MSLLKFGKGNAKLGKNVYTFSLPSGFTCPAALECLSKADRETGKIKDGPQTKFRCFSASQEALFKNTRKQRWDNFDALKIACANCETDEQKKFAMSSLIRDSLPKKANIVRIHVAGDFFSQNYFDAWALTAAAHTNVLFYFYTKSLNYWVNRIQAIGNGRSKKILQVNNFVPTASYGGRYDNMITQYDLRSAIVVYSETEAKQKKLEIDHDDTHAMKHGKDFALIIHGTQPAGSDASKALQKLKAGGFTGYSKKVPLAMVS